MMQCEECRIGRLQPERVPYLDWLDDDVLVAPDTPAWVCDVCGETHYDLDFLHRLQELVEATRAPFEEIVIDVSRTQKRRWQQL